MKRTTLRISGLFFSLALMVGLVGLFGAQEAKAAPINGSIQFNIEAGFNNLLDIATAINSYGTNTVAGFGTVGDYAATAGSTVTFAAFSFNPLGAAVTPLWTFSFGGSTYSFDLATVTIVSQGISGPTRFLILSGTGTAYISGAGLMRDPSPAIFSLSADTTTTLFNMSASGSTTVPEPATLTLLSLGFGLIGLAGWRRRRK